MPAGAFARELASLAVNESRLGLSLSAARSEIERLRSSGAAEPERRAAEQRLQALERQVEAAARDRAQTEGRFQREMEAWGKQMERQGEAYGRQMEEELQRYQQQLQRNLDEVKRNLRAHQAQRGRA